MINNIIDDRTKKYRWKSVFAIVAPTWHGNGCQNSDQTFPGKNSITYDDRDGVSVTDAVSWAHSFGFPVTLHLQDARDN